MIHIIHRSDQLGQTPSEDGDLKYPLGSGMIKAIRVESHQGFTIVSVESFIM